MGILSVAQMLWRTALRYYHISVEKLPKHRNYMIRKRIYIPHVGWKNFVKIRRRHGGERILMTAAQKKAQRMQIFSFRVYICRKYKTTKTKCVKKNLKKRKILCWKKTNER